MLMVLGNHEHYHRACSRMLKEFREALAPYPPWQLLERDTVVIGDVR